MKFSKIPSFALMVVIGLVFSGIFAPEAFAEQRTTNLYWTPEVATEGGKKTDMILDFIFWLTFGVFVLTQSVFVYYLIRYRRRPGSKAYYSHGNNFLEVVWTLAPTVVFLGLAIWGDQVWRELTMTPPPEDAITVEIMGYQYGFAFRYAGADGELDDVALEKISGENQYGLIREDPEMTDDFGSTELVIPVGKPVHVLLRSKDVIHSFYVPQFRLYQDMVPGRTIDWMWFVTTRKGNFELACSQLCGSGHYNMKAPIRVVSEEDYEKWVTEKVESRAKQLADLVADKAVKPDGVVVSN